MPDRTLTDEQMVMLKDGKIPEIFRKLPDDSYDPRDIISTMAIYYRDKLNVSELNKKTDIPISMIKEWIEKYPVELVTYYMSNPDRLERELFGEVFEKMAVNERVNITRDKAVERLYLLIQKEKDIRKVAAALTALNQVTLTIFNMQSRGKFPEIPNGQKNKLAEIESEIKQKYLNK